MVTLERIPALDQLEAINHLGTRATVGKNRNLCVIYVPMLYVVQKIFKSGHYWNCYRKTSPPFSLFLPCVLYPCLLIHRPCARHFLPPQN